ncbi:hypothetical protein LSH36_491g01016 [Paralvinella palmiformis]|uniref:Mitochondrial import receptor subunit TOM7 homolog n=1 Tax=Paralvinella palmiformis TaxID=53620 RepID=A0AAD9J9X0_9ANNE|nr:hypothetical protein LSH36_491g01016 [Paralvinella palmiformis]
MRPEVKRRASAIIGLAKFIFHWGFIPAVLYLGFRKGQEPGMPPLSLLSLLWQ